MIKSYEELQADHHFTPSPLASPSSWTSTLLPPLVVLITIYFSLLIAYRTLRSTVLLAIWAVKWGLILSVIVGVYAWWTGEHEAIKSMGTPKSAWLTSGELRPR